MMSPLAIAAIAAAMRDGIETAQSFQIAGEEVPSDHWLSVYGLTAEGSSANAGRKDNNTLAMQTQEVSDIMALQSASKALAEDRDFLTDYGGFTHALIENYRESIEQSAQKCAGNTIPKGVAPIIAPSEFERPSGASPFLGSLCARTLSGMTSTATSVNGGSPVMDVDNSEVTRRTMFSSGRPPLSAGKSPLR